MKKAYSLILSLLLPLGSTPIVQATQQTTSSIKPPILTTAATLCLASSLPKGLAHNKNNLGVTTIEPFGKDRQYVHVLQSIDNQNICQSQLSLLFEKGWDIARLATIAFNRQHHYIHIIDDHTNNPICYIGSIGLKGGGSGSSTPNSSDFDYDSYSPPSTPINSNNFDRSVNETHPFGDESCNNTVGNYIDKTYQPSCLAKDTDCKDDMGMNISLHSALSPRTEAALAKVNDFWFDHQKTSLAPSSKLITQSSSTISKQKRPSSSFTKNRLYEPTINTTTSSNKTSCCDTFSSNQPPNTHLLSLLKPSKDNDSSNDSLSSWENNNTQNHNPFNQNKPSIPSLKKLLLPRSNSSQCLDKCLPKTIHITKDQKCELKPEKKYQEPAFYNQLEYIRCKNDNNTDILDDFVSEYLESEQEQAKKNRHLLKLLSLKNEPEKFVSSSKQVLKRITLYNKKQQIDDVSKADLPLRTEYKLGNNSQHCDIPLLDLKKIGQDLMLVSKQGADRKKKSRLRKTGELIGMDFGL